jgi:hypothetical protein
MKEVKVILMRTVESAKFGIVIPNLAERRAWTSDNKRFFVSASANDDIVRLVVDRKDLQVIS